MVNGNGGDDNGSARVTVELVGAKLDGLKSLTEAGFTGLQRQLDPLAPLPATVATLTEKHNALEQRVADIEHRDEKHGDWRRAAGTTAAAFVVGTIVNLALTLHWV